jgi:transposase-like protein
MKPYATGRSGLLRCWPSNSVANAKGKAGRRWYVDETYLKVKGKWCYLYRAIDRDGNLVDSMLSTTREMAAAQSFFRSTLAVVKQAPKQVTTDGHDSYPRCGAQIFNPLMAGRKERFGGRSGTIHNLRQKP